MCEMTKIEDFNLRRSEGGIHYTCPECGEEIFMERDEFAPADEDLTLYNCPFCMVVVER
jgi:predicted RNA-binding Zn-ribbon protein involved in translation (DUF1610 family)